MDGENVGDRGGEGDRGFSAERDSGDPGESKKGLSQVVCPVSGW